ncbi:receptor-type tyrosine-protein phosphatase T-like [Physella acuta]|uniref:receptor-type tyrosine-protein phosphatase T-like n=1 Tax=Physella acuta TaxID=109671 RepID=UPI0027DC0A54|nr:receptor-type tyrosine-protein phosphatase T-like [Physella acuta]
MCAVLFILKHDTFYLFLSIKQVDLWINALFISQLGSLIRQIRISSGGKTSAILSSTSTGMFVVFHGTLVSLVLIFQLFTETAGADLWFGSNQQFLCRCTDNNCLPDGTCADGASCLSEWFGPSCQYQNLATVYTVQTSPYNALLSVTDDSQCNVKSGNTNFEVTWNVSNPFTFLWLRFYPKENKTTQEVSIRINNGNVEPLQVFTISNTTIEIRSPNISMIRSINITNLQDLCSLYVNGGRNIALKQTATQDSYFSGSQPSNAVDGNRNPDWYGGSCIHSAGTYEYHYWTVRFDKEYLVNRYVLYSRYNVLSNSPYNACCLDRLQHFNLVSRDVSGQTVLTYTENGTLQQLTYTVASDKLKVSSVTVSQANNILNFCEFEAYGDWICPPGKFGLECNKDCRCRNDVPCFTDTGTCSSGCAAGYTGMGCLTPCSPGTWDVDCANTCSINCLDMTSCDSITGACVGGCVAGFKTPTCIRGCDPGTWGINCSMSCSPHCGGDKSCDPVNGTCINGCDEGYTGVQCDLECARGLWGKNCQNNCSRHCVHSSLCDIKNGACYGGCVDGYVQPTCEQACGFGTWGINCSMSCSSHCGGDKSCDPVNGTCNRGCGDGFEGLTCNEACSQGRWGKNCQYYCSRHCVDVEVCNATSGACAGGCVDGYLLPTCQQAIVAKQQDDANQDINLAAIIAPIVAGVIVIVIVILGVILWRRRKSKHRPADENPYVNDVTHPATAATHEEFSDSQVPQYPVPPPKQAVDKTNQTKSQHKSNNNNEYQNTVPLEADTSIPLENLHTFLQTHSSTFFQEQFKNIPVPENVSTSVGQSELNKNKNRFKNICAYDHSRVHLEINLDENEGDYINASYVDGYKSDEKFIASQGPNKVILNDFIRMLWEQKTDKLVMLTNLMEDGKMKCERYWPEEDDLQFGNITVTLTTTEVFADYTIRKLKLQQKGQPPHPLTQFHFTSWPDQGVPLTPWALVDFEQIVSAEKTTKPIVVHCSAGVGRTGTFIALRHAMREAEDTGRMDFFKTLIKLRQARVLMIQTAEQYEFLHRAANVAMLCIGTTVTSRDITERIKFLKTNVLSGRTLMEKEFQTVCRLCEHLVTTKDETTDKNGVYQNAEILESKNRNTSILPNNTYRARISRGSTDMDDYINAVLVPSFRKKNHQILTQLPLPSTVVDFYRLVVQYKVAVVLALHGESSAHTDVGHYLPDNPTEPLHCSPFEVTVGPATADNVCQQQTVTVQAMDRQSNSELDRAHTFTHLKTTLAAFDVKKLLKITKKVQSHSANSDGRVLYMCSDGAHLSGLLCVLTLLLDRMDHDRCLTVPLVVGSVKVIRPQVISSLTQYQLLYEVLERYNDTTSTYSNFGVASQLSVRADDVTIYENNTSI